MALWLFKAIKVRHARPVFGWWIVIIEGMMNDITRLCQIFIMTGSCGISSYLNAPNKRNGSTGMKMKILVDVSIITMFLVALDVVKLIAQL